MPPLTTSLERCPDCGMLVLRLPHATCTNGQAYAPTDPTTFDQRNPDARPRE